MYLGFRKTAILGSIVGLILLLTTIICVYNPAIYTTSSNVSTRPFNVALVGKINTLEPAKITSHQERLLASAIYEGLVYFDEDSGVIKPVIANDWKYSADGKSLTINLKHGVKFHNGKMVTAEAVKAAWEKNFSTTGEWSNVNLFESITGYKERLEGKLSDIQGIQEIGNYTLKINFDTPNAAFIYMLTNPMFWVFDYSSENETFSGTGPYILEKNENKEIVLTRNNSYHASKPKLSKICFLIYTEPYKALEEYKAGKIDLLDTVPFKEIKNIKNSSAYKGLFIQKPILSTYFIAFNVNKAPFAGNYLIRRAFNYAIDRNAIIDTVTGGAYRPAKGVLPVGVAGYSRDMRGYSCDQDKALQLLEQAEFDMTDRQKPIFLSFNNDPGHKIVAQSVAQQLGDLGMNIQLQPMDWDYYTKQTRKMDLTLFRLSWQADYPDADSFLYSLFHSSKIGTTNLCGYHNPQVDKILNASREETISYQERIKLLSRAEQIIIDDAPCLWLFQEQTAKLIGKDVKKLNIDNMEMVKWNEVELKEPELDNPGTNSNNNKGDNKS